MVIYNDFYISMKISYNNKFKLIIINIYNLWTNNNNNKSLKDAHSKNLYQKLFKFKILSI